MKLADQEPRLLCRLPTLGCMGMLLVLLSGCAPVGPNFVKPDAPVAEGWLEADDERISTDAAEHREWWKTFNDPALDALIQRAYEDSPTLEIAGLRVHEARANLGFAVGTLYPQVGVARLSADRVELSENAEPIAYLPPAVQQGVDTSFTTYRAGFDATWELDFWGRYRRIVEFADASLAARVAAYDVVLVSLTGEVASAYMLLRTIEERLAIARRNAEVQGRSLEISEVRFRNEITSELDVVQAKVQLRDTQALIPRLEAAQREVENALSLLLGMPPGEVRSIIGGSSGIPASPSMVAVGMPADLLRRRPDIRQAEYLAAAQSARIGIAKAELYPSFGLVGTLGMSADDVGDLTDSDSFGGVGGIGFRWNILNFGRVKNQVRANDAQFQALLANYENVVLNAAREVENAQTAYIKAQDEVEFLEESAEASRRAVELARIQYRDGIADFTRVLTAQRAMLAQEGTLADAKGRVARNLIAVYRTLGGGWQIREGRPLIPDGTRDQMSERTDWGELISADAVEPVPESERGKWRAPDR